MTTVITNDRTQITSDVLEGGPDLHRVATDRRRRYCCRSSRSGAGMAPHLRATPQS